MSHNCELLSIVIA